MTFKNINHIEIKNTPKQYIKIYHYNTEDPWLINIRVHGTKETFFAAHDQEWIYLHFRNDLPVGTLLIVEWEVNS